MICWYGEPCEGLYLVECGRVKLFKLSPRGRELVIRVLPAGSYFNEVPVFDCGPNVVNAAALAESEIWLIPAHAVQAAILADPVFAQHIILNLSGNLRRLVGKLEELSFYQVTNRLARLLVTLTPAQLAGDRSQRLTQEMMAARLGTVREVVRRSLSELEASGAIQVHRGKIEVLDQAALEIFARDVG